MNEDWKLGHLTEIATGVVLPDQYIVTHEKWREGSDGKWIRTILEVKAV